MAAAIAADAEDLQIATHLEIATAHGFLVQADFDAAHMQLLADQLLVDNVVEKAVVAETGSADLAVAPSNLYDRLIHVMPKPGVMDPVAQSTQTAIADFGKPAEAVRTFRKYWIGGLNDQQAERLVTKLLSNDSVEQVVQGPIELDELSFGHQQPFELKHVNIRELDDAGLDRLSKDGQLYLTLVEMQTIQRYFQELERDPTDIELETVAQTWSEHCSHKTLAGKIAYKDEQRELHFENMLKETIFAATQQIRKTLGEDDWCVSVFKDNAGVVTFDDDYHVCFKVETHNHPSALEPYGGANTGIGGVIRDPMGTGLGAKPICNTDVFCFAPPDTDPDSLPPGVLHPRRVMKGVVAGVRDYGNRMGIPTVNGAVYFDKRYLGNPLVYCGNVGLIPVDKVVKQVQPNDLIVAVGGRTGRDGIHGATFSSAELTSESESLSGGAVQIGNAITEKMVLDVLLEARDRNLYNAVTDCGAGGFSSAVGEMGEELGAEVWLEKAPLKYEGLTYTEIWISEAQERMVLAVPEEKWPELQALFASEGSEATVLGKFVPTGKLTLTYEGNKVGELAMEFLHEGRPPVVRDAVYTPPQVTPLKLDQGSSHSLGDDLRRILSSLNVASKEWIIRQYDHEVQGGSVIKPLVGVQNDGPSDAAVVRPVLGSSRGIVLSCGMNPHFGDFDTYDMAASAIDEAIRNCVAVGADPSRIAILDNFCWGYTDRPETLGSLVRAALACRDLAIELGTPFISGKDSLNNEFSYVNEHGEKQTIAIPPTLLISAMGQVNDVSTCVTMDLKSAGNRLYVVGLTKQELGGSHWSLVHEKVGGQVPQVDTELAKRVFQGIHAAIQARTIRACHDLSEGGLAVALAEMAFAGGMGAEVRLDNLPHNLETPSEVALLFSESNTRFVCEVPENQASPFEAALGDVPFAHIGHVAEHKELVVHSAERKILDEPIELLKQAWQAPLNW